MKGFLLLLRTLKNKSIIRNRGKNNTLQIDGDILKKSRIKIFGDNNTVVIEKGIYRNLLIEISGHGHNLVIKSSEHISNLSLLLKNNSNTIYLEHDVRIGGARIVACGVNNSIEIGADCLLSDNIEIWGCDSHSIMQSGNIINASKKIVIGQHVWIGSGVKILKGTVIGNGSVVGMGSLVAGKEFPENVVIAGMPAKVVKENIVWTIENLEENFLQSQAL